MARLVQDFRPKTVPLPHQIEAIRYVVDHKQVALFDEQGLGKTKVVLDALSYCLERGDIDAVLIVAPLSLVFVWDQEVAKHSHLKAVVLRGGQSEKRYRILTGANFYIANYEAVAAEVERMRRFCRSRRMAIVLDEAARIKDPTTRTARALLELGPLAVRRIIVTGTPVANKPVDLWSQYYFLDQGATLGRSWSDFSRTYADDHPDFQKNVEHLKRLVVANSIRRTKDNVLELPGKTYHTEYVEMTGRQAAMYQALREELRLELTDLDGKTYIDEADNILKRLLRLTQIASNPQLVDRAYNEVPAKALCLDRLLPGMLSSDEKAILWTSFVDNIHSLRNRFARYKPLVIYGETPIEDRPRIVDRFQENESYRLLIANPAAAREGLTLTRANNAVYVDRTFNLADYLQSQDRIHRISQTRPCKIYKLIARDSIDEYIDRIIELKAHIASYIEGDITTIPDSTVETLINRKDLLELLR